MQKDYQESTIMIVNGNNLEKMREPVGCVEVANDEMGLVI
jgi:hypothetical protein